MNQNIALYDFDGTITKTDTLWSFIRFYHGNIHFVFGIIILAPVLLGYLLKIIPNWKAKEIVLTYFFKGEELTLFNEKASLFSKTIIPLLVRPQAMESIRDHKNKNHHVVVVTASAANWVYEWCNENQLDCIATQLNVVQGKLTGKISGKNCYGIEKVNRIHGSIDLSQYTNIFVYGDSRGDYEMMKLGTKTHFKPFR